MANTRMIPRDAAPISHVSPYRRIDPRYPSRKAVITAFDLLKSGDREPDPAIYRRDYILDRWILKDGV